MSYECEFVQLQERPTLAVRLHAPVERMSEVLGPAWGKVMAYAGPAGAAPADAPFVAYHNMDMSDLDLEVGFVFARPLPGAGEVVASAIAAGEAVQCVHVGPYDQVGGAYDAIAAFLAEHGRTGGGPSYEFYLNDPQETPSAQLRTRVLMPVLP